ncbi:hypothetical protein AAJ76_3000136702 [Vairimorpha ceranae]|uniref:Sm domain-containing protein n=1 Tax=Vairimorpha ceranae TaxID=40302 RepID=A0A0F9WIT7_9MICR|nr:hypothetical protein AAJ76_3000136702 [Vairimorpha ceranae]KKO76470.1 hypothetical protein AAJ76_3000136702 [Vairimorpha ceranae]
MKSKDLPNLNKFVNKMIKVKTGKGTTFSGLLKGHDAFMNIVLNREEEYSYIVIRGDNIINIELVEDRK